MPNVGVTELIIVLVVVLLLFGSTRLPRLARSLGQASREFRQGVSEADRDADRDEEPAGEPPARDSSGKELEEPETARRRGRASKG